MKQEIMEQEIFMCPHVGKNVKLYKRILVPVHFLPMIVWAPGNFQGFVSCFLTVSLSKIEKNPPSDVSCLQTF